MLNTFGIQVLTYISLHEPPSTSSNAVIIYCFVTNHSKTSWLKNNNNYFFCQWIYNLSQTWQKTIISASHSVSRGDSAANRRICFQDGPLTWLASQGWLLAGCSSRAQSNSLWAFPCILLHVIWASLWNGGWVPRANIPRERERERESTTKMQYHFLWPTSIQ